MLKDFNDFQLHFIYIEYKNSDLIQTILNAHYDDDQSCSKKPLHLHSLLIHVYIQCANICARHTNTIHCAQILKTLIYTHVLFKTVLFSYD